MKRYSKTTAYIYGMISLFIIIGVIFAVGFSNNKNNEDNHSNESMPKITMPAASSTKKTDKKIYNPYETVNFESCNMIRKNVLTNTNIITSNNEFASVFGSNEKYTGESLDQFLVDLKSSNDLFAVAGIYKISNASSNYVSLVKNKNIIGLEISEGNNLEKSIKVWDEVLTSVMPQLTIFGISKNVILLSDEEKEISERDAIVSGHYFSISSDSESGEFPEIQSITINNNIIHIEAKNYTRIEWITENGKLSGYGEEINPYATDIPQWNSTDESVLKPAKYIRAVIIGENAVVYTQAFGLQ